MNEGAAQAFAIVMQQIVGALIEMESMKAANQEREHQGKTIAYGESSFMTLQQNMFEQTRRNIEWIRG